MIYVHSNITYILRDDWKAFCMSTSKVLLLVHIILPNSSKIYIVTTNLFRPFHKVARHSKLCRLSRPDGTIYLWNRSECRNTSSPLCGLPRNRLELHCFCSTFCIDQVRPFSIHRNWWFQCRCIGWFCKYWIHSQQVRTQVLLWYNSGGQYDVLPRFSSLIHLSKIKI